MKVFGHRVRLCPPSLHASQQYITSWSLCGQPIGDHLIIIFGSVPNVHDDLISLHDCGPFALLSLAAKPPPHHALAVYNLMSCNLICAARFQELRSHKYLQSSLQTATETWFSAYPCTRGSLLFHVCLASILMELYNHCCPLTLSVYCRI